MSYAGTYTKPKPRKKRKVIAVEGGYPVLGGFRITFPIQGCGILIDAFGYRFNLMISPLELGKYFEHRHYYFRLLRFDDNPMFSKTWVFFGPFWLTIGRAYGGHLKGSVQSQV